MSTPPTPPSPPSPPIVLSFAASDPTGGAGIQADLLSIAGMGCHPLSVITAITVQDTTGVEDVLAMDAGWVEDQARSVLEDFLRRAWDEGFRSVLVITGKGVQGDGILRRRTPEWLGAPHLAPIVAGISEAHRRHGGAGALYVALKRKAAS